MYRKIWILILFPALAYGSSVGPNSPSSGTDDASAGTLAWLNPGNITLNDGSFATATVAAAGITTHYLKALTFGFSIPTGATITGIQLEIDRKFSGGSGAPSDVTVSLVKAGTVVGSNKAGLGWSTTLNYDSFGGSSDLWGTTWGPLDINDVNFGAVLNTQWLGVFGTTLSVDHYRITVTYTTGSSTKQGFLMEDFY